MATCRCSKCRHHFSTLEDEQGMHECPSCGYDGHDAPPCLWCNEDVLEDEHAPYCCGECAMSAELDSDECPN